MNEKILKAIEELRKGNFIIIHDSYERENECDFVKAAEFINPEDIVRMRKDGGGMICIAISKEIGEKLKLPFFSDIRDFASEKFEILKYVKDNDLKYDKKSAFSLFINSRDTFTGITDYDRALTIKKFVEVAKNFDEDIEKNIKIFSENFRTPGHVPILISRGIENRKGHTELSTEILKIAGLFPVAVICEILDEDTF
ncbi:MAG: 3,4-dihydroxy-2-butanone-4-phosphate synthase, partial [Candidatus Altarchaeaceae archaeon]